MAGQRITKAMNWLNRKLNATVARTVTIIAGDESLEGLDAVPVTANFVDYLSDEVAISAQRFDWIVQSDALRFAGVKLAPQPGWLILVDLDDGRRATYQVTSEAGARCYDVEDALGLLYVVHTKLDKVEANQA